jgi:5-methylcytosine-specific restriction endonuclease McrA
MPWSSSRTNKASSDKRGYGKAHRAMRARLLPMAYGTLCPLRCGYLMLPGQALELDHSVPLALNPNSVGDRIVHASCNRKRGAKLGRQLQRQRAQYQPSRRW